MDCAYLGNSSQRTVLHAELAIVLEEHHAIALGEVAFAAFDADGAVIGRQLARDFDAGLLAQFSTFLEDRPRLQVKLAHVGPGMGKNERSFFRPLGGAVLAQL